MTTPSIAAGPLDLDDIRARLTAATSGPWARGHNELTVTAGTWPTAIVGIGHDDITIDYENDEVAFDHVSNSADADLALITHAPEDIKNLLDEVTRLNDALREISQRLEEVGPEEFVDKVQIILEDNL